VIKKQQFTTPALSVRLYVISLPEAGSRRAFMTAQLDAPGMPEWRFVDAIRGNDLREEEIERVYDSRRAKVPLTPSQIACTLSHKKALTTFLEEGYDVAFILEDDVTISQAFIDIAKNVCRHLGKNSDSVLLVNRAQYYYGWGRKYIGGHHYVHKLYDTVGTQGYVVMKTGAQKLCDLWTPITTVTDDWVEFRRSGAIDLRCLVPYCIGHGLSGQPTHIEDRRVHVNDKRPLSRMRKHLVRHLYFQIIFSSLAGIRKQRLVI
jgi:glycosyl transferase family 25